MLLFLPVALLLYIHQNKRIEAILDGTNRIDGAPVTLLPANIRTAVTGYVNLMKWSNAWIANWAPHQDECEDEDCLARSRRELKAGLDDIGAALDSVFVEWDEAEYGNNGYIALCKSCTDQGKREYDAGRKRI